MALKIIDDSNANQPEDSVILGLAESFSRTLAILLNSFPTLEAISKAERNVFVGQLVHQGFTEAEIRNNLQEPAKSQLRCLRDRVIQDWKALP